MAELGPGAVFDGRYRLDRLLARGGMAEVFVGHDLRLERAVAVKVLAAEGNGRPGSVARFRREALAAAGLSHPNIVAVFDSGEAQGVYFIVMEYIAGRTLTELISQEAPLSTAVTADIGARVAAALEFAHGRGVIHRDIKPGNVLLTVEGAAKLTDFGIARVTTHDGDATLTAPGMVIGTPSYLSPEQVEGRPLDPRSDIYSLGAVLYEMATGVPPFRADTALATAYHQVRSAPVPASERNPAVPYRLNATIMRALAKHPAERQPDAATLGTELTDVLADPAAAATSVSVPGLGLPNSVAPTVVEPRPAVATGGHRRASRVGLLALLAALVVAFAILGLVEALSPSGSHRRSTSPTTAVTTIASTRPPAATSTRPAATSTLPAATTTPPTVTTTPPAPLAVAFAGYQVVAGSGSASLYCPAGVALGQSGQTPPTTSAGPANTTPGGNGTGGPAGCGSNGGSGGSGAPGGAGGSGGNGGAGGCPPATLAEMRSGSRPCTATGSNGGNGGNGAPGAAGGRGGSGGPGGQTTNAKGGNGGNGGNAKPGAPGGPGGDGGAGGGPTGTASGVNGSNGTPGTGA